MTKQAFTIFRVFTSTIFIYAGMKHLIHPDKIFIRVAQSKIYGILGNETLFTVSIILSGIIMVVAGLSLLAGYKMQVAAILLLMMLIPITLTTQLENLNDLGPFFKNMAIAGSLILIIQTKLQKNEKNNSNSPHTLRRYSVVRAETKQQ